MKTSPWYAWISPGEREALEAIARALDERRSLVLTHARYDREADESGVIINPANVVSVRERDLAEKKRVEPRAIPPGFPSVPPGT